MCGVILIQHMLLTHSSNALSMLWSWYKMFCCVVLCCVVLWYGMVWYGMVWYGMVWYGMVWYGMSQNYLNTSLSTK